MFKYLIIFLFLPVCSFAEMNNEDPNHQKEMTGLTQQVTTDGVAIFSQHRFNGFSDDLNDRPLGEEPPERSLASDEDSKGESAQ